MFSIRTDAVITLELIGLVAGHWACNNRQPELPCPVARGRWSAKYELTAGQDGAAPCAALKGEVIGVQKYNPPQANGRQDPTSTFLAIQSSTLGGLSDTAHYLHSIGSFSTAPDSLGFCTASALSRAELQIASDGGSNPMDISYEWSNVRVGSTVEVPGNQLAADLKYADGSCAASYSVTALWPQVDCFRKDSRGQPVLVNGHRVIEPFRCSSVPLPDAGMTLGSGIDPAFPVTCDPDLMICVLTRPPLAVSRPGH